MIRIPYMCKRQILVIILSKAINIDNFSPLMFILHFDLKYQSMQIHKKTLFPEYPIIRTTWPLRRPIGFPDSGQPASPASKQQCTSSIQGFLNKAQKNALDLGHMWLGSLSPGTRSRPLTSGSGDLTTFRDHPSDAGDPPHYQCRRSLITSRTCDSNSNCRTRPRPRRARPRHEFAGMLRATLRPVGESGRDLASAAALLYGLHSDYSLSGLCIYHDEEDYIVNRQVRSCTLLYHCVAG